MRDETPIGELSRPLTVKSGQSTVQLLRHLRHQHGPADELTADDVVHPSGAITASEVSHPSLPGRLAGIELEIHVIDDVKMFDEDGASLRRRFLSESSVATDNDSNDTRYAGETNPHVTVEFAVSYAFAVFHLAQLATTRFTEFGANAFLTPAAPITYSAPEEEEDCAA